ncbi:MAG: acyltransferase, partial [Actinomycetota bacterium]|nr:acyltransferase [Actinomycetota bacterium]
MLLAHAGLGFAAGGFVGVDVFYVISGYLITGILLREAQSRGTISLLSFYGRRARRLLPAAALVIVATLVASALILSPARSDVVADDAVASSLYFVNWRFVAESADYFGAAADQSPLQHYWSLAIEEQFYLVWPLLILAVTLPLKRFGASVRTLLAVAIALISAASLAYSVSFSSASA